MAISRTRTEQFISKVPARVLEILKKIWNSGFDAFPVGGCVRDLILGKPVADWDLTTNALPEQLMKLFPKVIPTGMEHGTVTVLMQSLPVEVTTYRTEGAYSDGRHPDLVHFVETLEEDLMRRDFTMNAIALDVRQKRVIDPFGGVEDLQARVIRAVGDPLERFTEDGLRPMRAVRFAAVLDFRIEEETLEAIGKSVEIFKTVAMERIREELMKLLAGKDPVNGVELLRTTGMLDHVLPGLTAGMGQSQNKYHLHDVYYHALASLENTSGDPVLKLAVLLHDIGKPACVGGPEGQHTFYGHEKESARQVDLIMKRLRFSNKDRQRAVSLVANHMFHYEPDWTDGAVRRFMRRVGPELLDDLWEMRRADALGGGVGVEQTLERMNELKNRIESLMEQDQALKVTDLAITGQDVMRILGKPQGPWIGQALNKLLEKVLDDPSLNTPEHLEKLLLE